MGEIKTITKIDLSKVAVSRSAAKNGDYVSVYKQSFLSDGVTYNDNGDGTITVLNNGIGIGVITTDAILETTDGSYGTKAVEAEVEDTIVVDTRPIETDDTPTQTPVEETKSDVPEINVETVEEKTEPTPAPVEEKVEKPLPVVDSNVDLTKYSGNLHSKRQASDDSKGAAGVLTSGNQGYTIVPDSEYTKAPGTISQSDYNLMIAQVAGESANNPDDMLGVACTMLNRLEAGGGYGSCITEVLEKGYFPWGRSYKAYVEGGKYYNTDWGQDKLAMVTQVVNDALNGIRNVNSNVYYYSGDGTNNYFSDVL